MTLLFINSNNSLDREGEEFMTHVTKPNYYNNRLRPVFLMKNWCKMCMTEFTLKFTPRFLIYTKKPP